MTERGRRAAATQRGVCGDTKQALRHRARVRRRALSNAALRCPVRAVGACVHTSRRSDASVRRFIVPFGRATDANARTVARSLMHKRSDAMTSARLRVTNAIRRRMPTGSSPGSWSATNLARLRGFVRRSASALLRARCGRRGALSLVGIYALAAQQHTLPDTLAARLSKTCYLRRHVRRHRRTSAEWR
jgi:hypothetical protein